MEGILKKYFHETLRIFTFKTIKFWREWSEKLIKLHEEIDLSFDYRICAGGCIRI